MNYTINKLNDERYINKGCIIINWTYFLNQLHVWSEIWN